MTKNIKIIKKINTQKKKNIKNVFKKIILKSIFQSNDVRATTRLYTAYVSKLLKTKIINKITKNFCFETSKIKTTSRVIGLSRYSLKNGALKNQIQNFNVYSK